MRPAYYGRMDPVHPCREMGTRHCPAVYDGPCGERPCARYESEDETPWLPELDERGVILLDRPPGEIRAPRGLGLADELRARHERTTSP